MRGVMANNSHNTHNVQQHQHQQATSHRPAPRDRSPDPPMGRSGCCTSFLCLGSLKRGKRIVPATRMHDSSTTSPRPWGNNGSQQSGGTNPYANLSPSLLAPPSSPASFQNSAVQSSAQSPCAFPVAQVPAPTSQIPLETAQTMFQMGPYAHETALVSPPVFSTFTTAPSTAPFTPPPELANNTHLTTPSSPDVPFAQLLANSFGQKQAVRVQPAPNYSASPFTSPEMFSAEDLQAAYQLYPGSPLAHLLSPASGTGASTPFPDRETSAQFPALQDMENPVRAVASMFLPGSPVVQRHPPSKMELDVGIDLGNGEQELSPTTPSFLSGLGGSHEAGGPADLAAGNNTEQSTTDAVDKWSDECHTPRSSKQVLFGGTLDSTTSEKDEDSLEEVKSKLGSKQGMVLLELVSFSLEERSKLESSEDQADRNLSEEAAIRDGSSTKVHSQSPDSGADNDTSSMLQEPEKSGFSDQGDRNSSQLATCNSSDTPNKCSSEGDGVSVVNISPVEYESSDQVDRNLKQTGVCNSLDIWSKLPSKGDVDIPAVQGQDKRESSDQADRNSYETATCDSLSDPLKTCSKNGNGFSLDTSVVVQQEHDKRESADPADRNLTSAETFDESTVGGNHASDGHLEQCKQEFSNKVDRDHSRTIISFNTVPNEVSDKQLRCEGNGVPDKSCAEKETGKWEHSNRKDRKIRTLKKSPSRGNCTVEFVEAPVDEVHPPMFNPSLLGFTIGDLLAWETLAGEKVPSKLSISKISVTSRAGSPVHSRSSSRDSTSILGTSPVGSVKGNSPVTCYSNGRSSPVTRYSNGKTSPVTRYSNGGTSPVTRSSYGGSSPVTRYAYGGTSPVTRHSNGGTSPATRQAHGGSSPVTRYGGGTSPVTRLSNGGNCADCVTLQHVTLAASEGYFDVSSLQQFNFPGQTFEAETNCNKETLQDCSREKPERERGILKVLLKHSMEKSGGIEGKDRIAVCKEQQLNVPVSWIQSKAK